MTTRADFVELNMIRDWTDPDTFDIGTRDAEAGRVTMLVVGPVGVTAIVGGTTAETVELCATLEGLRWTCTCNADTTAPACRHVVATAVETRQRFAPRV
jgi:uncharacterized Zn finger protein